MKRWTTIWLYITKGYRHRMLISMLGIMISLMFVVGVLDLIKTVETALIKEMNVEKGTIYARKKAIEIGIFDVSSYLSKAGISDSVVSEINDLPGIKSIHKETWSRFPVQLSLTLMGRSIRGDATLLGVEPDAVEERYREAFQWTPPKPGEPPDEIPILAPKMLLTAYNAGFAEANGMPKVTDRLVKGLKLEVRAGANTFERLKKEKRLTVVGTGVTNYGNNTLAGIVPLESLFWLHKELDVSNPKLISGLAIAMEGEASPEQLNDLLSKKGLVATDSTAVAEMFASVSKMLFFTINIIGAIMYISGAVILFVLYRNQMLERAPSLHTLTRLGVKRAAIMGVLLVENILMTAVGIFLGYLAGRMSAAVALPAIQGQVADRFGLSIEMPALLYHDQTIFIVLFISLLTVMVNIPNMIGILKRQ